MVKKKVAILLLLLLVLTTSLVNASNDLFDEYGIRKNVIQKMSMGEIVQLDSKRNVSIDKEWTVTFNKEVELDKIFAMSIKQEDEFLPVDIDISGEKEAKIIPVYNYAYNTQYSINISLMNGNQYKMDFKTIVNPLGQTDKTPPKVLGIKSLDYKTLILEFDEKIDVNSLKCEIYEKDTGNQLKIWDKWYTSKNDIIIITDDQDSRKTYELVIQEVTDIAGNAMNSKTLSFTGISYGESDFGFNRYNPFKFSWNYGLKRTDRDGVSLYNIGVYDIIRGNEALSWIKTMNQFNDDPAYGKEYILVEMYFKLQESDTGYFDLSPYDFKAVSGSGVTYNSPSITFKDKYFEKFDRKIYDGAEFRGWLAFEVDKYDEYPLLLWSDQVWFELYD